MKLKLKIVTCILIMLICTFTRCKRQLDLAPQGELTEATFYQTEANFDAATISAYVTLQTYYYDQFGSGWYQPILYPDDDVTVRSNESNQIEDFNWLPSNGSFQALWEASYKGVQRANVILEQLPKAQHFSDEANKPRYEGEAKFMRAYFNFVLALHWGNPPVADTVISDIVSARLPNSQPGEIWDLIQSDLNFAKKALPANWPASNTGRATSGAASGLLGRVLLYRAQWERKPEFYTAADAEFSEIIAKGDYRLTDRYADNFDLSTENNSESLFEVQFAFGRNNNWNPSENGGGTGTGRYIMWRVACESGACADGANGDGYGYMHVVTPLQNEFERADPRRVSSVFLQGDPFPSANTPVFQGAWSVTGSTPSKYIINDKSGSEIAGEPNMGTNNERVLRYADILLMSAECKILGPSPNLAAAAALINQVRRRADPGGSVLPDRSGTGTATDLFRLLMHERRVELALEGHRYNDLVRWHRAGLINIKTDIDFGRTPANNNWQEKNLLKPIPQRELDLNKNLAQTTGY
ncbi:MAG: RagB/SusD family nutrient uptake outer membrane protein [Ferruginibacter sp.]